ncbi:MAG: hypothetical protein Q4E64_03810 [Phascolarctobacterium sp.]|uniref:hypothetical protein n=1 Tax=Phascolarctobacterium sp. TaxID=2049039 RepID=UPI0026DDC624|nr:hypothetical protein [Phascolarctobacterium sp.]MDO4920939.1 hypothetical protein [Phascolarctobacterium sp.]
MTEEKEKGTWGGARPGAGRKRQNGDIPTKQVQFRLTAEQEMYMRAFLCKLKAGMVSQEILAKIVEN